MSEDTPQHPLWDAYVETQLREFAEKWDWFYDTTMGWASHPRPVAPDEEIALYIETKPEGEILLKSEARRGIGFRMRHVDGRWLLAGFEADVRE